MKDLPSVVDMLKAGLHFGHKKSRRHPKMDQYIYTTKGELCIIDVRQTSDLLGKALEYLSSVAQRGGTVLLVSTKKQSQALLEKYAKECDMPYVSERWLGGTVTNYPVISQLIKKLKKLKEKRESGELAKYTKKEQLEFTREIEELELSIGGMQYMTKLPDVIFILDLKKDKTALDEAIKKNIPVVAVCDTNTNPEKVTYVIPGNDDAIKSIDMILGLVAKAINEGRAKKAADMPVVETKKEEKKAAPAEEAKA